MNTDELSLEAQLALLSDEELEAALAELDVEAMRYSWEFRARPKQLRATNSLAYIICVLAGRGFGKTLTGSEWVRKKTTGPRPTRGFLVARTAADVRDTLIQGESGILSVFPPSERPEWIPSQRTVRFANGSTALCLSAKEPDQARGPQSEWSLCDELAAWEFTTKPGELSMWDNVKIATRLGDNPQIMATTTPKRVKAIRDLLTAKNVEIITGSTYDNIALSAAYMDVITGLYAGTRLGAQELYAEILDEVEGALWKEQTLLEVRTLEDPGKLPIRVIGVDPSTADDPHDEAGIVAVGATSEPNPLDRTGWVLEDFSGLYSPAEWAKVAADAAVKHDATIVAEANQGGAMVREMIHNVNKKVRVRLVHAKVGKKLRAEPIAAIYEQAANRNLPDRMKRIRHLGTFPELDDQLTTWVPGETKDSPDRVDALVHGLTAMLLPAGRGTVAQARISAPGRNVRVPVGSGAATGGRRR